MPTNTSKDATPPARWTRAIQAFDSAATRYPIHRQIRCAASNKRQDVLDDLALHTGLHDAFVIEDADHLLQPRTDDNRNLHRFLMIADGVVRAQSRKIIFTTNLPNISSIDEAPLRPGRCFAPIQMRPLARAQTDAILNRLLPGDPDAATSPHRISARGPPSPHR